MSGQHLVQPSTSKQLVVQTFKQAKALYKQVREELLAELASVRELSRPVRRKSAYPSMRMLAEAVEKLEAAAARTRELSKQLKTLMKDLRARARPGV